MKIVAGEDFRRALRELVRKETPVKANDDFSLRAGDRICAPKIRRRLRHAPDIGKGKILRDDRAPAVRSEFDLSHCLWDQRCDASVQTTGRSAKSKNEADRTEAGNSGATQRVVR